MAWTLIKLIDLDIKRQYIKVKSLHSFRSYLDRLAEEVNDKLQEEGHVTIPELTKLYDLPGDYLAEVCCSYQIHYKLIF